MNKKLVNDFLRYIEGERNCSPHTVRNYSYDITEFMEHLDRISWEREKKQTGDSQLELFMGTERQTSTEDLAVIDKETLRSYLSHLQKRSLSPRTIARRLASIRSFCRFLSREGYLEKNPTLAIRSPRLGQELPDYLTEEEMENLLSQPDRTTDMGIRDAAVLETLYSSGIRASELCGLNM